MIACVDRVFSRCARANRLAAAAAVLAAAVVCHALPGAAGEIPSYLEKQARTADCKSAASPDAAARPCTTGSLPENDLVSRVNVFTARGYEWLEEEEPIPAVSDFSRALVLDPTVPTALKGRARAYERLEKYEEALNDWTSLIELHPRDTELYCSRGQTHRLNRNYEAAIADYTKAIELKKSNVDGFIGRALAQDALDRLAEAVADFEEATQVNEKNPDIYLARGEMWERRGDSRKAISDFQTALRLSPENMRARRAVIELTGSLYAGRRLSE